jgi:hypothetical protein
MTTTIVMIPALVSFTASSPHSFVGEAKKLFIKKSSCDLNFARR